MLIHYCKLTHMLRFDKRRSIAATAIFFSTAVVMTRALPHLTITPVYAPDWNISSTDRTLLVAQAVPIAASIILYTHVRPFFLSPIIYSYHLSLSLTGIHNICPKSIWWFRRFIRNSTYPKVLAFRSSPVDHCRICSSSPTV